MTKGTRYAYLPFFYGEEDAEVRQRNRAFLDKASGGVAEVTPSESLTHNSTLGSTP